MQSIDIALIFVGSACITFLHLVTANPQNPIYYTAAILEHARQWELTDHTAPEIKIRNLRFYQQAASVAKSKEADIIIFPEYALYPYVNRTEKISFLENVPIPGISNPCLDEKRNTDKIILRTLSCMARKYKMFVVANMGDIQPCTNASKTCPEDGTYHYNANVVFDRKGTLVSRYYKEHLFFEEGMDLPTMKQNPVFETDFGSFAHFTCFDIVFKHIVELSNKVDNVILLAMWFSNPPFFNSIHKWNAWAETNQVNFLVSNAQIPGWGALGSGVFTSNLGALKYTYNPDGSSKLLVTRVPKDKHHKGPFPNPNADITVITPKGPKPYDEDSVDFNTYLPRYCSDDIAEEAKIGDKDFKCWFPNLVNYTVIELNKGKGQASACNNGMCCSIEYYSTSKQNETYYLAVANTTYNAYDRYYWCEEACAFFTCDALNGSKCIAVPTTTTVQFKHFTLRANFSTKYVYPSVIRTGFRLPLLEEWNMGTTNSKDFALNYHEIPSSKPILSAGLYGRCFERDPPYTR